MPTFLANLRNKDCKKTELGFLLWLLPVRLVTFVETLGKPLHWRVILLKYLLIIIIVIIIVIIIIIIIIAITIIKGPSTYSQVPHLTSTGCLGEIPSPLLFNVHMEFHTPMFF